MPDRLAVNLTERLIAVDLVDAPDCPPEVAQDRQVAILDLLDDNRFALPAREGRPEGPWRLALSATERHVVFALASERGDKAGEFHLSLGPFRQVIKDYDQICRSYYDAVRTLAPAQIETIDMARRGIHNEGARILQERLAGKADLDEDTSRRLFTLICALRDGA